MLLFVGTKPIQTQQLMLNGKIFTVNNQLYQFVTTVHETWLSVSADMIKTSGTKRSNCMFLLKKLDNGLM